MPDGCGATAAPDRGTNGAFVEFSASRRQGALSDVSCDTVDGAAAERMYSIQCGLQAM